MKFSRKIKLTVVIVMALTGNTVLSMTPGSTKSTWKPESVAELSANEIRELKAVNCDITSYRSQDVEAYKDNTSGKPDDQDYLMLIRGEFSVKGQSDLVVLCESSKNKERYLYFVWGGIKQCKNKLLISDTSRFMKKYGNDENYYGGNIQVISSEEVLPYINRVFNGYKEKRKGEDASGSIVEYWKIEEYKTPKIVHDSIMFSDSYTSVFYCDENTFVQLLDVYTDYID